MTFDVFLATFGFLLLSCLFAQKILFKTGLPSLLLFLGIGMLAGEDGPGGIKFEDAKLANYIGTVALAFILFSGGLNTDWKAFKSVLFRGSLLSTLGVALTAFFMFCGAYWLFRLPLDVSLLLSVILSSTDAPAVFNALRSSGLKLKNPKLQALLETESGSNDPMAVILSMAVIGVLTTHQFSLRDSLLQFGAQMGIGVVCGYFFGHVFLHLLKNIDIFQRGVYPVIGVSSVFLIYALTQFLGGNGFLALYLAGILLGNKKYYYRDVFNEFHDALAWVMQITMFLTLGLLTTPHEFSHVFSTGLGLAVVLMLIARPLAVALCLIKSGYTPKEQLFIFWAGLKGATPIILATYPLMISYPAAPFLFNMVFFLVIISVFVQGKTLPELAKAFDLAEDAPVNGAEGSVPGKLKNAKESMSRFLKDVFAEVYDTTRVLFSRKKDD